MNSKNKTALELQQEIDRLLARVAGLEAELASRPATQARNQAELATVLENTTDAIWSVDTSMRLNYFNSIYSLRFQEVLGHPPLLGQSPEELLTPELAKEWRELYQRALDGESFKIERTYELLGEAHAYDISLHPVLRGGVVTGVAVFSRDVTEYKRSQENLVEKTSILESILDNISDGVVVANRQGKFILFNPAAERIIGVGLTDASSDEWTTRYGLFLSDMVTPYPADQLPLVRAIRGEAVDDVMIFVRHLELPEGIWISVSARPLIDKIGLHRGGVAVFRDVSESKRSREAIEAEQQFLQQLILAHERDRQLMAYEIHDGMVQEITGALMHLEACGPPSARGRDGSFETALKLLRESLDDGRRLISGLRPPILDEMGIVAAIDYLVGEHVAAGVSAIRFNHDVHFERLEPLLEGTIFRIAQEALTNIKRHSQAPTASVELRQVGGFIQLQVKDQGVGYDPAKVDKRRFGLKGIRERARLLGGRAVIESAPGKGARIFVELPITHAGVIANKRSNE